MPVQEGTPSRGQGTKVVIIVVIVAAVLLVGCVLTAIVAAIAIPSFLRARISANEASAVGSLRSLVTSQSVWRQTDTDRNGVADYWTGDVSGLYRVEAAPAGSGIGVAVIDVALAQADDRKVAGGAPVAGAKIPGTATSAANLIGLTRTAARNGQLFRALTWDEAEKAYAQDPDGNGQKFTNLSIFGFQARPEAYNSAGINTYIVNEAGVIYGRDFGNAAPGNADQWPGTNPAALGWRAVR